MSTADFMAAPTGAEIVSEQDHTTKIVAQVLLTDENFLAVLKNRNYDLEDIKNAGNKSKSALVAALKKRKIVDNRHGIQGAPLLNAAILSGSTVAAEFLLTFVSDDTLRSRAMRLAIKHDCLDMMDLLYKHEVPLEQNTEAEDAISNGKYAVVEYLLDHGVNANHFGSSRRQGNLKTAIIDGQIRMIELLLRRDANPNGLPNDNLLWLALSQSRLDIVQLLLKYGANVDGGPTGCPLCYTISPRKTHLAEMLISLGADVNKHARCEWWRVERPVQFAARHNLMNLMKLMIVHGADLDPRDEDGSREFKQTVPVNIRTLDANLRQWQQEQSIGGSPLQIASSNGNIDMVKLLLKHNTSTVTDAFRVAAGRANRDLMQLLISHGANIEAETCSGHTALSEAISNRQDMNALFLLDLMATKTNLSGFGGAHAALRAAVCTGRRHWIVPLLTRGADANAFVYDGCCTLLCVAAWRGYGAIVDDLLQHGADPNLAGGTPAMTPLYAAVERKHVNIARALLRAGADVHVKYVYYAWETSPQSRTNLPQPCESSDETVLGAACRQSSYEMVVLLIAWGADVHECGSWQGSPIRAAVGAHGQSRRLSIIRLLVAHGLDVNVENGNLSTPIEAAIVRRADTLFEYLIQQGARVTGPGCSALHTAVAEGLPSVIDKLLELGADVNCEAGTHGFALQAAVLSPFETKIDTMKLLLAHGADVNACGGVYGTALQAAVAIQDLEAVRLLLDQDGIVVNIAGGKYGSAWDARNAYEKGWRDSGVRKRISRLLRDHGALSMKSR